MMSELAYMTGFGNTFASEAQEGALPVGQNSPQRAPFGLYAEKFSATAFTAPRAQNARSWFYRIRPSVVHGDFREVDRGLLRTGPDAEAEVGPNPLRWNPPPLPEQPLDVIAGLETVATNGDAPAQRGVGIHNYRATRPMENTFFYDADGELLFVPQHGALRLDTEAGSLDVPPGHIAVVPRGMKFRVGLPDGPVRGYLLENYGARLELPELGPIGSDGLANSRDFETPVARFEDRSGDFRLIAKFGGRLFACDIGHSPLDVVAWHGNVAPYRYDLRRFNVIGSISYDHPDPSIFTVLTSVSDTPGIANVDFVVFPPRWLVAEHTFRPPWFHRNVMSEYMGLVYGEYDAKAGGGFVPGGASLHNCMSPHGPDAATYERASSAPLSPQRLDETLAFMFESRYPYAVTRFALESGALQRDYTACWQDLGRHYPGA